MVFFFSRLITLLEGVIGDRIWGTISPFSYALWVLKKRGERGGNGNTFVFLSSVAVVTSLSVSSAGRPMGIPIGSACAIICCGGIEAALASCAAIAIAATSW